MADQVTAVNAGFFDAINSDRTYSADQMNRPYKRIISNGVFATPSGTPSTDLQVVSAGSGMGIICKAGEGLFANKWFENPSDISITVPNNNDIVPRLDSVIAQVDTRSTGRVGNIVYRTGTASSNPAAPAINQVEGVVEYRLANVLVAPSATSIGDGVITDMRGSSDCPWVTSLVYQVDTSELFNQWQAAYSRYFEESTEDFEDYTTAQEAQWEAFIQTLTSELSVTMNMIVLSSVYTSSGEVTNIPINIASFDADTDVLMVYINGLKAVAGVNYNLAANRTSIDLTSAIGYGQKVHFVVFHNVIGADVQTTITMIQALDAKVDAFMHDSGWNNLTLSNGAVAFSAGVKPAYRKIGNRVFLRGAMRGLTSVLTVFATLPAGYRPEAPHVFTVAVVSNSTVVGTVAIQINGTTGAMAIVGASGTIPTTAMISLATDFVTG